jgi:hypothetical protein
MQQKFRRAGAVLPQADPCVSRRRGRFLSVNAITPMLRASLACCSVPVGDWMKLRCGLRSLAFALALVAATPAAAEDLCSECKSIWGFFAWLDTNWLGTAFREIAPWNGKWSKPTVLYLEEGGFIFEHMRRWRTGNRAVGPELAYPGRPHERRPHHAQARSEFVARVKSTLGLGN